MYNPQTNLAKQVFTELKTHFTDKLFKIPVKNDQDEMYVAIPRNIRLAESPSFGKPIILYDAKSSGSVAYQDLAYCLLGEMSV